MVAPLLALNRVYAILSSLDSEVFANVLQVITQYQIIFRQEIDCIVLCILFFYLVISDLNSILQYSAFPGIMCDFFSLPERELGY